jgi:hypothetical protein
MARQPHRPDEHEHHRQHHDAHELGALSRQFESHGRLDAVSPGRLADGRPDPGGVSYGPYQMTSQTVDRHGVVHNGGTVSGFLAGDGAQWAKDFGNHRPGTPEFSKDWVRVAHRDGDAFLGAQETYLGKTHFQPFCDRFQEATGVDLRERSLAVQNAAFSSAIQHGGNDHRVANHMVEDAKHHGAAVRQMTDAQLVDGMYDAREKIAGHGTVGHRYAQERHAAHAMLDHEARERNRDAFAVPELQGTHGQGAGTQRVETHVEGKLLTPLERPDAAVPGADAFAVPMEVLQKAIEGSNAGAADPRPADRNDREPGPAGRQPSERKDDDDRRSPADWHNLPVR